MSDTSNNSGGIGFVGALLIVFIVLKFLGKITWSWWWVLSPVWITAMAVLVILGIICVVYAVSDARKR